MGARSLGSLFKSKEKQLVDVPIWSNNNSTPLYPTNITIPTSDRWGDFDYIEIQLGNGDGSSLLETNKVNSYTLAKKPTSWSIQLRSNNGDATHGVTVTATSENTIALSYFANIVPIASIIGYKRKIVGQNYCKTVDVNFGADITVGKTYEVDIATVLGKEFLNKDLLVEVMIENNSGTGEAGWFKPNDIDLFYNTTYNSRGISTDTDPTTIYVMTGKNALSESVTYTANKLNAGLCTTTKCKIKVWAISNLEITMGGGSGNGFPAYTVVAENTALQVNQAYAVDVSSGARAVVLPPNPEPGDMVYLKDYDGSCSPINSILIDSYRPFHGKAMQYALTNKNSSIFLSYIDDEQGWHIIGGVGLESGGLVPYEEVDILLPAVRNINTGDITLPAGYKWSDFDRIEVSMGVNANNNSWNTVILTKEVILESLDWVVACSYSAVNNSYYTLRVSGINETAASWFGNKSGTGSVTAWPYQIKGYLKPRPVMAPVHQVMELSGITDIGTVSAGYGGGAVTIEGYGAVNLQLIKDYNKLTINLRLNLTIEDSVVLLRTDNFFYVRLRLNDSVFEELGIGGWSDFVPNLPGAVLHLHRPGLDSEHILPMVEVLDTKTIGIRVGQSMSSLSSADRVNTEYATLVTVALSVTIPTVS